jgi:hypothetical protein
VEDPESGHLEKKTRSASLSKHMFSSSKNTMRTPSEKFKLVMGVVKGLGFSVTNMTAASWQKDSIYKTPFAFSTIRALT